MASPALSQHNKPGSSSQHVNHVKFRYNTTLSCKGNTNPQLVRLRQTEKTLPPFPESGYSYNREFISSLDGANALGGKSLRRVQDIPTHMTRQHAVKFGCDDPHTHRHDTTQYRQLYLNKKPCFFSTIPTIHGIPFSSRITCCYITPKVLYTALLP